MPGRCRPPRARVADHCSRDVALGMLLIRAMAAQLAKAIEGMMVRKWLVFIECLVLGHDDSMRRSPGRLFLQCERCGRETPGWTIASTPRISRALRQAAPIPSLVERRADVASNHDNDQKNAA